MIDVNNLNIIIGLENKNDYPTYVDKCKETGLIPEQLLAFAQRVGILSVSSHLYPELDAVAAYQKLLDEPPIDHHQFAVVVTQSKGLGDTVAKITHATGLDELAKIYTRVTGKDCGCKSRQEFLNKLVPYNIKEEN